MMTDELGRLEDELRRIEPARASSELERRIAERLAHDATQATPKRVMVWRQLCGLAAAGLFLSICLAAIMLMVRNHNPKQPSDKGQEMVRGEQTTNIEDLAQQPPILQSYRLALRRSPEALQALLVEHERMRQGEGDEPVRARIHESPVLFSVGYQAQETFR